MNARRIIFVVMMFGAAIISSACDKDEEVIQQIINVVAANQAPTITLACPADVVKIRRPRAPSLRRTPTPISR